MKKIIVCLLLNLMLITGISGIILAQEVVMKHNVELSEEQKMLWKAYGINPNTIKGVWVHSFVGTPEEAKEVYEEMLKRRGGGVEVPEMHKSEGNLGDVINNTITIAGEQIVEIMGQEWLETAKEKAAELKNINQVSYITGFEDDGAKIQINIDSPYLSPITLEVYEGTYIIQTEVAAAKEEEFKEALGKEVSLDSELPIEYLRGDWTIKERELKGKYATQVPNVTIRIEEYIGSIKEIEIEAERLLFSGEIKVEDNVYKAYPKLDPENIYAYPICYISILKESGAEPVFDIMVMDNDIDYELFVTSDLKQTYEKAFTIKINSSVNDEDYQTGDDKVDYLIRK